MFVSVPSRSLMPSTTAIVFVSPPCFMIGRYADSWPSTRTMLLWIWLPSTARPTSPIVTVDVPTVLIGAPLMSSTAGYWLLVYSA